MKITKFLTITLLSCSLLTQATKAMETKDLVQNFFAEGNQILEQQKSTMNQHFEEIRQSINAHAQEIEKNGKSLGNNCWEYNGKVLNKTNGIVIMDAKSFHREKSYSTTKKLMFVATGLTILECMILIIMYTKEVGIPFFSHKK